jgi:hypothetical protein
MSSASDSAPEPSSPSRLQPLRTGLLIAGSALLGGLAVVLWNRSSLSRLRQPAEAASQPPVSPDEEEE